MMASVSLRRSLTQSEKQKYFVENKGTKQLEASDVPLRKLKYHAARVVECPQNVVELRKLLQECHNLDKAKSRVLTKITGEQKKIKAHFQDMFDKDENELNISRSFLEQPGFRYRNNGEVRDFRKSRIKSSKRKDTSSRGAGGDGYQIGENNETNIVDWKKEIKLIEDDLKNAKSNSDINKINKRLLDIRSSLDCMRGKESSKDSPIADQPVSAGLSSFPLSLTIRNPTARTVSSPKKSDTSPERFSRQCSRSSCTACQHRLKCSKMDDKPMPQGGRLVKRWYSAPRGVFVNSPETWQSSQSLNNQKQAASQLKIHKTSKSAPNIEQPKTVEVTNLKKHPQSEPNLKSDRSSDRINVKPPNPNDPSGGPKKATRINSDALDLELNNNSTYTEDQYRRVMSRSLISNPQQKDMLTKLEHKATSEDVKAPKPTPSFRAKPSRAKIAASVVHIPLKASVSKQGKETLKTLSVMAVKAQLDQEKEDTSVKIEDFLIRLPEAKPSITRWRASSGQELKSAIASKSCTLHQSGEDPVTAVARENRITRDVQSLPVDAASKLAVQEGSSHTEGIQDCRYLRINPLAINMKNAWV